jgi:hypothetical protein
MDYQMIPSSDNPFFYDEYVYQENVPTIYDIDIQNEYQLLLEIRQELYLIGELFNDNQQIIQKSLIIGMKSYLNELTVSREMSQY